MISGAILTALQDGKKLLRNPWTRLTWIETSSAALLFAAGQPYDCEPWLAEALCESQQPRIHVGKLNGVALDTLTHLINNGHFMLTAAD